MNLCENLGGMGHLFTCTALVYKFNGMRNSMMKKQCNIQACHVLISIAFHIVKQT